MQRRHSFIKISLRFYHRNFLLKFLATEAIPEYRFTIRMLAYHFGFAFCLFLLLSIFFFFLIDMCY